MADKHKPCSVKGCNGNANTYANGAHGWCSAHYQRWRRHGDPIAGRSTMSGEPLRWLQNVAAKHTNNNCLPWPYACDSHGYGTVSVNGITRLATRVLCQIAHGPPPAEKQHVAHSCGKGHLGCTNPKHLRWATRLENAADRLKHGTANQGGRHGMSKLTESDVRRIRNLAASGVYQSKIAEEYGLSGGHISNIVNKKSWRHLPQGQG